MTSHRSQNEPGYSRDAELPRSAHPLRPHLLWKLVLSVAATLEKGDCDVTNKKDDAAFVRDLVDRERCMGLLYEEFTVATIIYGKGVFAGGVLVFVGLAVVWEDYIAPLLRRKFSSAHRSEGPSAACREELIMPNFRWRPPPSLQSLSPWRLAICRQNGPRFPARSHLL